MISNKSETEKILENIIFMADVFGDLPEKDIPLLPVLEMARCFELAPSPVVLGTRMPRKNWLLWS